MPAEVRMQAHGWGSSAQSGMVAFRKCGDNREKLDPARLLPKLSGEAPESSLRNSLWYLSLHASFLIPSCRRAPVHVDRLPYSSPLCTCCDCDDLRDLSTFAQHRLMTQKKHRAYGFRARSRTIQEREQRQI